MQPLSLPHCPKGLGEKQLTGGILLINHFPPAWKEKEEENGSVCVCVVVSDMKHYQRALLPPVTAQPSHMSSVVASILEHHTAELSAAQEWDNEWNSQGLLSHLTPQAKSPTDYTQQHCMNAGGSLFRPGSFQDLDSCRAQVLSEIKIVICSIRTILGSVPTLFWRTTRPQCQSTMLVCDLLLLNRCVCC